MVVEPTIGEYVFVDLNDDRTVELVVTVDFRGRGFYNTVNIIRYANSKLHSNTIRSGGVSITNLKSRIVDLNGDGSHELLVPRALAQYAGANPIPIVKDVYQWNGEADVKSDRNFPDYYRNEMLPKLKAASDALNHGHGTAGAKAKKGA